MLKKKRETSELTIPAQVFMCKSIRGRRNYIFSIFASATLENLIRALRVVLFKHL